MTHSKEVEREREFKADLGKLQTIINVLLTVSKNVSQ